MASVNKVILVGNLGKDPEIRTFQSGGRVASFSIATGESWKDKTSGEKKERTEWHRVSVLNNALVGVVERFLKKGSKVYLEGQLETRKWTDKDGRDCYATEVVLRPFHGTIVMLGGNGSGGSTQDTVQNNDVNGAAPPRQTTDFGPDPLQDLDDEIPF